MGLLPLLIVASFATGWWVVSDSTRPRILADGADGLYPGMSASPALVQLALQPNELGRLSRCSWP